MPLFDLADEEALAIRKRNPYARWGDRASLNRVEPLATPAFDVNFKMRAGESIFTVGSCFARNVEEELLRRGFRVPAREVFKLEEFRGLELNILNNYGTPSIYNEFAWAFGEQTFQPDQQILEIAPDKFADLNFSPAVKPDCWEATLRRRQALAEMYRSVRDCRVVIMTLGLAETWFDTESGTYLNLQPRQELIKKHPGRFRLHVLAFDEAYRYLDDAIGILKRHCKPDMRMLLTVSPVPLGSTFRPVDVMVANSYSKSVLRAVAETAVSRHDFISYYPSYESVLLSNRRIAFIDDLLHVSEDLVKVNVGRMIDAFVGDENIEERVASEIDGGGAVIAAYRAADARSRGGIYADRFFVRHAAWVIQSTEFAEEYAQHLLDSGNPAEALKALRPGGMEADGKNSLAGSNLLITALMQLGRTVEALDILDNVASHADKAWSLWNFTLEAAIGSGNPETVIAVLDRSKISARKWTRVAGLRAIPFFREKGLYDEAIACYELIRASRPSLGLDLEYAETLLLADRIHESRKVVEALSLNDTVEPSLKNRLELFEMRLKSQ